MPKTRQEGGNHYESDQRKRTGVNRKNPDTETEWVCEESRRQRRHNSCKAGIFKSGGFREGPYCIGND